MESEVVRAEMLLAPTMAFKKVQTADKYPKGQSRGRQWKHLRQWKPLLPRPPPPPPRDFPNRLAAYPRRPPVAEAGAAR